VVGGIYFVTVNDFGQSARSLVVFWSWSWSGSEVGICDREGGVTLVDVSNCNFSKWCRPLRGGVRDQSQPTPRPSQAGPIPRRAEGAPVARSSVSPSLSHSPSVRHRRAAKVTLLTSCATFGLRPSSVPGGPWCLLSSGCALRVDLLLCCAFVIFVVASTAPVLLVRRFLSSIRGLGVNDLYTPQSGKKGK